MALREIGGNGVNVFLNLVRVALASAWTALLGTPVLLIVWARYIWGWLQASLGFPERFDRVVAQNAYLACWVAQRLWTGVLLAIAGIRLRVREAVPVDWQRTHVICANHASIFDILALVRVVPIPFRFVAKRELEKWPIIGWALRPSGQILIDRQNRAQAIRAIAEAAARKIRGQVIFFVEGTRSRSGELLPFKKGAFHFALDHRLPILPTAICGSYAALARVPWWRLNPGRTIEIRFGSAIEVDSHHHPGVDELMTATRAQIVAQLDAGDCGPSAVQGAL
ncbi:MAG: 1-acyl-sn-glycerol-3-phosphate acyltransferase [Candidatus Binatia bacterium]|nr:1-acyl-sn-glycerol-3-phosphate acyltransferase [Candidatus Binatia bacterium]